MKVVLKHSGRWLHFSQPEKVLLAESVDDVLPMLREAEASGLFAAGFVSYEASPAFDNAFKTHNAGGFPLLCLGLFRAPEVLDNIELYQTGERHSTGADENDSSEQYKDGGRRSVGAADNERDSNGMPSSNNSLYRIGPLTPSILKELFIQKIDAIKERIAEGATYQVNYTYRLKTDFFGDAWAFFYELVKGQRAEYAAFIETEDFSICSASPELFFSLKNGQVISRPMKGTAKRGRTFAEDSDQAEALRNSEKDQAENIMIVDMVRNDIGRIAESGSVETVSRYDVEKYPTVWQMTSTVQGKIKTEARPEVSGSKDNNSGGNDSLGDLSDLGVGNLVQVMQALFPCASITGAPKAKTMEIIHSLESTPRKVYTGAIGFATPQGEACFSVAIRTVLIENEAETLEYGVGGGIVWDSDAEAEYEETFTKARVLTQPRPEFQLLETMRWEPESGIFLLNEHVQRLGKSAAYFDVPLDIYTIQSDLDRVCGELDKKPHRLRLLVSRDGSCEVQTFPLECDQPSPGYGLASEGNENAKTVALAKEPIDSQDVFLFHKTTHRMVYESALALAKADEDVDDVILWNEKGEITESCFGNVVIRRGDKLITPPIECGLLAGTFRQHLLKAGEIEESVISVEELKATEEVFLINSVRKWQKVKLV